MPFSTHTELRTDEKYQLFCFGYSVDRHFVDGKRLDIRTFSKFFLELYDLGQGPILGII